MNTRIHFIDFEAMPHHKSFVLDALATTVGKFEKESPFEVLVWVAKEGHAAPGFVCEVLLKSHEMNGARFVKKSGPILFPVIKAAVQAAAKILRRDSRRRAKGQRTSQVADSHYSLTS